MNLNEKQKTSNIDSKSENTTLTRFRNILLEQIYEGEEQGHPIKKFEASSSIIMLPRVQLSKTVHKDRVRYEMLNTSSEVYYVMEDWRVFFAYKHGLQVLSDSLCFTFKHAEIEKTRRKKCNTEEDLRKKETRLENLYESYNKLKNKNVINLKQVKNEYNQGFINASKGR